MKIELLGLANGLAANAVFAALLANTDLGFYVSLSILIPLLIYWIYRYVRVGRSNE